MLFNIQPVVIADIPENARRTESQVMITSAYEALFFCVSGHLPQEMLIEDRRRIPSLSSLTFLCQTPCPSTGARAADRVFTCAPIGSRAIEDGVSAHRSALGIRATARRAPRQSVARAARCC